jgi:ATP-binding cassette subfamily B protein
MHEFIMRLPGNYDFNVMERGATMSQGQRQLLSFIRALLYNPSILILDEATSAIDTETEQLIQHAIDKLIEGRTSIVIAHRLSTIRKADKIIVLDKGEIREMGTHDELLQMGGYYAKLHEMQFAKAVI